MSLPSETFWLRRSLSISRQLSRIKFRTAPVSQRSALAREQLFSSAGHAENDPAHKNRSFPYAIIAHNDTVLHYVRGKKAGELRRIAKGSIGIGGHMNDTDESLFAWDENAYRPG